MSDSSETVLRETWDMMSKIGVQLTCTTSSKIDTNQDATDKLWFVNAAMSCHLQNSIETGKAAAIPHILLRRLGGLLELVTRTNTTATGGGVAYHCGGQVTVT